MTALPLKVLCCIRELACTVTRNCSSPLSLFPAKKFGKTEQMLNGHACTCQHTMTALPLQIVLHQGAHTTTTRQGRELGPLSLTLQMGEHIQLDTDPHPNLQLVSYKTKERVVARQYKYSPQSSSCSPVPSTS